LTVISQLVAEPFAGRMKQVSSDLSALLETLQVANQRNRQIFEHSLELLRGSFNLFSELRLLRGSFNLFSELRPSSPVYHRTGAIQNTPASGRCVCDEI